MWHAEEPVDQLCGAFFAGADRIVFDTYLIGFFSGRLRGPRRNQGAVWLQGEFHALYNGVRSSPSRSNSRHIAKFYFDPHKVARDIFPCITVRSSDQKLNVYLALKL